MKQDPLSDFLKQHAGLYEVKPSDGLFDSVINRRTAARRKRITIWFSVSMVAAMGLYFISTAVITNITKPAEPSAETTGPKLQVKNEIQKPIQSLQQQKNASIPIESRTSGNTHLPFTPHLVPVYSKKQSANVRKTNERSSESIRAFTPALATAIANPETKLNLVTAPVDTLPVKSVTTVPVSNDSVQTDQTAAISSLPIIDTDSIKPVTIPPEKNNWALSAFFTVLPASNVYSRNSEADLLWLNNQFDSSARKDKSILSYAAGIKIQRLISSHFGILAGLNVSRIIFQEMPGNITLKPGSTASLNSGNRTWEDLQIHTALYRYDQAYTYAEFQAGAFYRYKKKKWLFDASAALAVSRLIATKTFFFDSSGSNPSRVQQFNDAPNHRFKRQTLLATASVTAGHRLFQNCYISAGPSIRFNPAGVYSDKKKSYFMTGLEAGIKFIF